jgi:hypothetical protein
MRGTVFTAAMTAATLVAGPVAAIGSAASAAAAAAPVGAPAGVRAATCGNDGVTDLCASTLPSQDSLAIDYQVTQLDGPGTYSVLYTDTASGQSSLPQAVGPLAYQAVGSGTLYAQIQHCYDVTLTSAPGTSLTVGPVCG